jgi:hypothetical protein
MSPESNALRDRIHANVTAIQRRMADAAQRAGRAPEDVTLIAVTKYVGLPEAEVLVDLGVTDMGENRLPDALAKVAPLHDNVRWHMLGNVQRRKLKDVVQWFDTVDAIDRMAVAEALQRRCEDADRTMDALLEVNVSGEESKHGFVPASVPDALRDMAVFDRVRINGLLTMAPYEADEVSIRTYFGELRTIARDNGLKELSMGMTNDFELGIEEGATQVRIGRALFE